MNALFEYMNYRDFLRDFYEEKKAAHSFYSYRLFSQQAGFKSPNFLKLVIEAERNLSKESVFKFCKALRLNKKEAEYFENLVFFNQSKTLEEKNTYLSQLMKYRAKTDPEKIEKSEYAYLSQWYHPVVRELVTSVDFKGDHKRLGQSVVPSIGAAEAEKSVKLLLDLRFIRPDGDGGYERTSAKLTTGFHVQSVGAANYHRAMIGLAAESIERFPSSERDINSLTLSVSEETYRTIITRMRECAMDLLRIAEADKNDEMVAQVNLQVFPLSVQYKKKERPDDERE
jgi:uncharacterized protein (TIGR02147 family)